MKALCIKEFTFLPGPTQEGRYTTTVGIIYTIDVDPVYSWYLHTPEKQVFFGLTLESYFECFKQVSA